MYMPPKVRKPRTRPRRKGTIIPNVNEKLLDCVVDLPRKFTTADAIECFSKKYTHDWRMLVEKYGEGRKGEHLHYSARNYIGRQLKIIALRSGGRLRYLGVVGKAPEYWGGEKIALFEKR